LPKIPLVFAVATVICIHVACGLEPWESMPYKSDLEVAHLPDGTKIRYALAEPPLLNPENPQPVVLVMPLGFETYKNASLTISEIWRPVADTNRWVIVSPAEPDERYFWQDKWIYGEGGEFHFPGFLAHLSRVYNVRDSKFHMVSFGHNGDGAVACVLAAPDRFSSVTLVPDFDPDVDRMRLLGQEPNIRTKIFISDQVNYWNRDGGKLSFDVPGVVVQRVQIPDQMADEGIGFFLEVLPFVCEEIASTLDQKVEQ